MILQIVCVRDRALDVFGRPVFVQTLNQAVRSFQDEVNSKDSDVAKHPDDYELYHVGSWDDSTSRFSNLDAPKQVAIAANLVRPV